MLDHGERVEADNGYSAECPATTKTPTGITSGHGEQDELNRLQQNCHKTVNERFKNFGCMSEKFRHSIEKHGWCFFCVAIIVQLSMTMGSRGLFPIIYDDTVKDFDAGLIYMPKTARPWTKERAAMKARQQDIEHHQEERRRQHRQLHKYNYK